VTAWNRSGIGTVFGQELKLGDKLQYNEASNMVDTASIFIHSVSVYTYGCALLQICNEYFTFNIYVY